MTTPDIIKFFIIKNMKTPEKSPCYIGHTTQTLARRLATFKNNVNKSPDKYDIYDTAEYFILLLESEKVIYYNNNDEIYKRVYELMREYDKNNKCDIIYTLNMKISYNGNI